MARTVKRLISVRYYGLSAFSFHCPTAVGVAVDSIAGESAMELRKHKQCGDVGQKAARYNLVSFVHPDSVFITCTYVYRTSRSGAW
jgi:hypothetical protein